MTVIEQLQLHIRDGNCDRKWLLGALPPEPEFATDFDRTLHEDVSPGSLAWCARELHLPTDELRAAIGREGDADRVLAWAAERVKTARD